MKAASLVFVASWLAVPPGVTVEPLFGAGADPACSTPVRPVDATIIRGGLDASDDGDAAIQDDAPAAQLDGDESVASPLEPLGTLASARDSLRSHRTLSRRSPRGPPVFR